MIQKFDYVPITAKITTVQVQGQLIDLCLTNLGKIVVMCQHTKKMYEVPWQSLIDPAIREGIAIRDPEDDEAEKKEQEEKEKEKKEREEKMYGKLENGVRRGMLG